MPSMVRPGVVARISVICAPKLPALVRTVRAVLAAGVPLIRAWISATTSSFCTVYSSILVLIVPSFVTSLVSLSVLIILPLSVCYRVILNLKCWICTYNRGQIIKQGNRHLFAECGIPIDLIILDILVQLGGNISLA